MSQGRDIDDLVRASLSQGAAAANLSSRKRLFVLFFFFPTAEINARAGRETQKKHVVPLIMKMAAA